MLLILLLLPATVPGNVLSTCLEKSNDSTCDMFCWRYVNSSEIECDFLPMIKYEVSAVFSSISAEVLLANIERWLRLVLQTRVDIVSTREDIERQEIYRRRTRQQSDIEVRFRVYFVDCFTCRHGEQYIFDQLYENSRLPISHVSIKLISTDKAIVFLLVAVFSICTLIVIFYCRKRANDLVSLEAEPRETSNLMIQIQKIPRRSQTIAYGLAQSLLTGVRAVNQNVPRSSSSESITIRMTQLDLKSLRKSDVLE